MCQLCVDPKLAPADAVLDFELQVLEQRLADTTIRRKRKRATAKPAERLTVELRRIWRREEERVIDLLRGLKLPYRVQEHSPTGYEDAWRFLLNGIDVTPYEAALVDLYRDVSPVAMTDLLTQAARGVGIGADLMANPRAQEWVKSHTIQFSKRWAGTVSQTTNNAIRKTLADGWGKFEGTEQLTKRVQKVYGQASDFRAELIARDQGSRAYNTATFEMGQELKADVKFWILSGSPYSYVDVCGDNANMGEVPLNKPFKDSNGGDIDGPPAHGNCLCDLGYDFSDTWQMPQEWKPVEPAPTISVPGVKPVRPKPTVPKPRPKRKPVKAKPADAWATAKEPGAGRRGKAWANKLTKDERFAVDKYRGQSYDHINPVLRAGKQVEKRYAERVMKPLDVALGRPEAALKSDAILWRGTPQNVFGRNPVGKVFSDKGFISTASDRKIAEMFASGNVSGHGQHPTLYRILAPKGSRAADLGALRQAESEFLLPRNTKFRCVKKWASKGTRTGDTYTVYDLEVVL